jgi:uncharacterized protein
MIRKSSYLIEIPFEESYVFVNSFTGNIDKLSANAYKIINELDNENELIKYLLLRGHLTENNKIEEKESALKLWNELNDFQSKKGSIVICPSTDCNFRCTYCFERSHQSKIDSFMIDHATINLTTKQVDSIFDNLDFIKNKHPNLDNSITLYGGEPLWAKNYEVVKYLVNKGVSKGFTFSAVTNGYDVSLFSDLFGSKGINFLQITIDGLSEIHDEMRPTTSGGKTFDRIISEIKKIIDIEDLEIQIRLNYDANNMNQIPKVIQFLNDENILNKKNVRFHANLISLTHDDKGIDYGTLKHYPGLSDEVQDFTLDCYTSRLRRKFVDAITQGTPLNKTAHYCDATFGMYIFCPDNKIYSCWEGIGEEHSLIGSYGSEIELYDKGISDWHNRNAKNLPDCQNCNHLFLCGGGCAVHAYQRTGKYNVSECDGIKKKFAVMVKNVLSQ